MFVVIDVGTHGNDGRDGAFLGNRGTHEYGKVCVPGEIAAAADAVHHSITAQVCRIDMAEDVDFQGRVHGNNSKLPNDRRIVGYLLRPQHQPARKIGEVAFQLPHLLGSQDQTARACTAATAAGNHFEGGRLQNFAIHDEVGDVRAFADALKHGIGHVADAALQWQKLVRHSSAGQFVG